MKNGILICLALLMMGACKKDDPSDEPPKDEDKVYVQVDYEWADTIHYVPE